MNMVVKLSKLGYFEKATKIWRNLTQGLDIIVMSKP